MPLVCFGISRFPHLISSDIGLDYQEDSVLHARTLMLLF
jgi:hypothetical protein